MAWIKVPSEHHPLFRAALPNDRRVETMLMFGGIAAKVNGHVFAGLFGRSAIVLLDDIDRAEALALDGAAYFDPMGNGRLHSDKVMLPEDMMHDPIELRSWIARAFKAAAVLPKKKKATKAVSATSPANLPAAEKRKRVAENTHGPAKKKGPATKRQLAKRRVAR
jgi:TfoX/Sxy family transcriptional regulator of competence genes